jgi:hypothetical protein
VADVGGETAAIVTNGLTIRALQDKVASLLRHHWSDVWEERASALLRRVETLADERNRLVHSLWYATDSEEGAVSYRATARGSQGLRRGLRTVSIEEVEHLAVEMATVAGELHALGVQLYPDFVRRHVMAKPPHSESRKAKSVPASPE